MLRRIGLISASMVLLSAASASASTRTIEVTTFAFPAKTGAVVGDAVRWHNTSGFGHTVTGDSPLKLWNKSLPNGATVQRGFTAAGSFPYHCEIHPYMTGTIKVSMTASPKSGTTATSFRIAWATVTAAPAFTYQVQKRAPDGVFSAFKKTTSPSAAFKATQPGTWRFRARLVRIRNGAASGWSPTLSINIS